MHPVRDKWNRIYESADANSIEACEVLKSYQCFLPASGNALDVACGLGANALLLANTGLSTTAVDISDRAIDSLANKAGNCGLAISAIAAPVEDWFSTLGKDDSFDVIVVSRFLDRSLVPVIIDRLRDRGLVFYQTFVKDKVNESAGPSNPDYLLDANELLLLFKPLLVRAFYDPGSAGRDCDGIRNESYLVAQKMGSA